MTRLAHSLLSCLCILGAALSLGSCNSSFSQTEVAQLWGTLGAGIFDIIKAPDSVEYYHVVSALPSASPQTYQAANQPQTLSDENIKKLQKLLLNDGSYHFDATKTCVFIPETAFRFKKGEKEALVLVSMSCKQIRFDLGDQKAKRLDIDPVAANFADYINSLPK